MTRGCMMSAAVDTVLIMPLTPNQSLRSQIKKYSADSNSLSQSGSLDEGVRLRESRLVSAQSTIIFSLQFSRKLPLETNGTLGAGLSIRWHKMSIATTSARFYSCLTRTQVFSGSGASELSQDSPYGNGNSMVKAAKTVGIRDIALQKNRPVW